MSESFSEIFQAGGHKNTLGRAHEVLRIVLEDRSRLGELYESIFDDDAWVRMRAIDVFEKVCREHPDWIEPYIDRLQSDVSSSTQPSIQWHLAQIYMQVRMNDMQKSHAVTWLKQLQLSSEIDWIAAVNGMKALAYFVQQGDADEADLRRAARVLSQHKSNTVQRCAKKYGA